MTRAGYDRASGTCAGRSQPGAVALMAWSLATYEPASNLGIYNCRSVRGGTVKSVHADGRALDVAFPLDLGHANPLGHELASRLTEHADALGIQLVIFDRMVWSSKRPKWTPHTGASGPHVDHVHIELTWAAARGSEALTVPEIERILGPLTAPSEDDMPLGKDIDDDRRSAIRGWCWDYWGHGPTVREQSYLLAVWHNKGMDAAHAAVADDTRNRKRAG